MESAFLALSIVAVFATRAFTSIYPVCLNGSFLLCSQHLFLLFASRFCLSSLHGVTISSAHKNSSE
jgi:hypothetical protein